MKQMCKKKYPSPRSFRNELSNPRYLTFTDYSKASRVRKFYPAITCVMDINNLACTFPEKLISRMACLFQSS